MDEKQYSELANSCLELGDAFLGYMKRNDDLGYFRGTLMHFDPLTIVKEAIRFFKEGENLK